MKGEMSELHRTETEIKSDTEGCWENCVAVLWQRCGLKDATLGERRGRSVLAKENIERTRNIYVTEIISAIAWQLLSAHFKEKLKRRRKNRRSNLHAGKFNRKREKLKRGRKSRSEHVGGWKSAQNDCSWHLPFNTTFVISFFCIFSAAYDDLGTNCSA